MNIFKSATEENIYNMLEPEATSMGYEIVRVQLTEKRNNSKLQIMIERIDGDPIVIKDCESASRAFSAILDVENIVEQKYALEISSAGLNRPLTRKKDYSSNIGENIKLHTNSAINGLKFFEGELKSCNDDSFELAINKNKEIIEVQFDNIKHATLVKY